MTGRDNIMIVHEQNMGLVVKMSKIFLIFYTLNDVEYWLACMNAH